MELVEVKVDVLHSKQDWTKMLTSSSVADKEIEEWYSEVSKESDGNE